MIDHMTVNVSNFKKSLEFYKKALAPLGYEVLMQFGAEITGAGNVAGMGEKPKADLWLSEAAPQKPIVHVAFRAKNHKQVDEFYKAALAAGGRDNGAPGPRPHYHDKYYGAFVYDPDGHNIEVVCHD